MRNGIAVSAAGAAALALTAGTVVPAAASAPRRVPGPDPAVTVEIMAASGSGCSRSTTHVNVSDEWDSFTVFFKDGYTARVGGSSKPADARKNCQLTLKISHPSGGTYAISQRDYRLHANLQPGAKATYKAAYFLQTGWPTDILTTDLTGPYDDDFQVTHQIPADELVWKPCRQERTFTITTDLRLDKGTSDPSKVSHVTMTSTDVGAMTYHFAWKRCP